ncbi:MAG: hypothetical protein A2033_05885 [Bacteroidetes bacterium GWA2_31_9]|nr:MAG: hypothetical protein A2033_05885 [Bacteroidetes bacterium GWA2_31_9]
MKKIILPILAFIVICFNVSAQKKSNKEKLGDKFAFSYSYSKAIKFYSQAKQLTFDGQRHLAECYHKVDSNIQSELSYSILLASTGEVLPEDYFNYAMVLKINGKYDESNKWMDKLNEIKPSDLRAKDYVSNKSEFVNMQSDNGKYKTEKLSINTDAQDFGASYYKNNIVFASSRTAKMMKRKDNVSGKPFLDIYMSEEENGKLKDPVIFDKSLNSKKHDGPASFSNNGTFMAFTRNHNRDKSDDRIVELQIYFSTYVDEKWSKPEPFILNNSEYSVGHPCLTADGKTMYFTSDMPGGYGGSDIYKITKNEQEIWATAVNMGDKINTESDEMFPFFHEKTKALYFASNGRFGLGGLDIFISEIDSFGVESVRNAGNPLNTQYDDFAAILNDSTPSGYFSSDRNSDSRNDDIYSYDILYVNKQIAGIAKTPDGNYIPNTFITLYDENNVVIDTVTTKVDGAFGFKVSSNKNFKLTGKKENYTDGETVVNTLGSEEIVIADVILVKESIEEKLIVGADLSKVLKLKTNYSGSFTNDNIYFDYGKYNIRDDAEPELDKIIKIMNEYPNMEVKLSSYTDSRASKEYNQVLSNNRAIATANYIKKKITNPERISGKGYGETNLVNDCAGEGDIVTNCTEEEHQLNRRSEFIIMKNELTKK